MFVVSFSGSFFKKIFIPVTLVGTVALVCVFSKISSPSVEVPKSAVTVGNASTGATELLDFISSYGWEVKQEPDEVREVVIPAEFDDVYTNYNSIQLAQGLDLLPFKGQRVKKWTYTVTNYPGYETEDCIKINILVYEGCVIGGDVCSIRLDGFMHGFEKE